MAKAATTKNAGNKKSPTKAARSSLSKGGSGCNNNKAKGGKTAAQMVLETLAQFRVRGVEQVERNKIPSAGFNPGSITNALTSLKKKGYVDEPGPRLLRLTPAGIAFLGPLAEKPSNPADVHDRLKQALKGKSIKLFNLISDGKVHDREALAQALGYGDGKSNRSFLNLVYALGGKNYLAKNSDKDSIQLDPEICFPFGLPE